MNFSHKNEILKNAKQHARSLQTSQYKRSRHKRPHIFLLHLCEMFKKHKSIDAQSTFNSYQFNS